MELYAIRYCENFAYANYGTIYRGAEFRFKVIGGHTAGSSVIYFEEQNKDYVITGDECYVCDNILKNVPNGNCTDYQKNEKFISDAHNKRLIPLPYHDNKVFSDFKQISKNIVRII